MPKIEELPEWDESLGINYYLYEAFKAALRSGLGIKSVLSQINSHVDKEGETADKKEQAKKIAEFIKKHLGG